GAPTRPFGRPRSRSNSALISAGQSARSDRAAFLSSMVRVMGFLQGCRQHSLDFLDRKDRQQPGSPRTMAQASRTTGGNRRAIVIGGSMSGLFAGLLLRRHGFDVDIYERVESEL